jgi:hypothetical protein
MKELELTIAVLEQLKQPFEITSEKLIIKPTSSPMLECLPGDWFLTDSSTELHIDLIEGPFVTPDYIAYIITQVANTI